MIVILGYNNLKTEYLNQILESNGLEYKYSLLENDIIQADKIILPHLDNFNSTYRRMNLMNLFSVLRMIKNPILGINNGFRLMCNDLINKYKKGLGFFNFDIICIDGQNNNPNIVEGNLKILENSTLLDSSYNKLWYRRHKSIFWVV